MTGDQVAALLAMLHVYWPEHKSGDKDLLTGGWLRALAAFDGAAILAAADRYVQGDHAFFPTPGQIIAVAAEREFFDVVPELAWQEVMRQAAARPYGVPKIVLRDEEGHWRSVANPGPSFSHPLIRQAVEAIGWRAICQSDDLQALQRTFFFTLKALVARATTRYAAEGGAPQAEPTALPPAPAVEDAPPALAPPPHASWSERGVRR